MKKEILEKLEVLDAENDEALVEAVDHAKSLEEIVEILKARGVNVTEADLTGVLPSDELTEEALEEVAGGCKNTSFGIGLIDGCRGKKKRSKKFLYSLGYAVGTFFQ